ncbi:Ff.00g078740.m01.CDS01 [Fusarium sp. VM40]|nr:Ff.00g078740.m01.CDS01 [Fusarium sp. VM40]
MARSIALAALLYALPIAAKTDIEGCTSFTSTVTVDPSPGYGNTYETVIWYVPDTLEICKGVDCGGGRAPPKSIPGCPLYKGTETVTVEFLKHYPMSPKTTAVAPKTEASLEETNWSTVSYTGTEDYTITDDSPYTGILSATETLSTDAQPTNTLTRSETETKKPVEPKTTAMLTRSFHNETMTSTESSEETTKEQNPSATVVNPDSAAAGLVVKAGGVLAGVAGAIALVL